MLEGESIVYPPVETWLRHLFRQLAMFVARRPYFVITVSSIFIALLAVGNVNYRLERSLQGLWTPGGARTVKDKDRYEAAFGPFYRVENLIFATTPSTPSSHISATGLPSIVTYENIDLMFRVQEIIDSIEGDPFQKSISDSLAGHVEDAEMSYTVKLEDVCYKPLGVCVVENVIQYWQLDRSVWEAEVAQYTVDKDTAARTVADYCFQEWTTQCTSTFQSPIGT